MGGSHGHRKPEFFEPYLRHSISVRGGKNSVLSPDMRTSSGQSFHSDHFAQQIFLEWHFWSPRQIEGRALEFVVVCFRSQPIQPNPNANPRRRLSMLPSPAQSMITKFFIDWYFISAPSSLPLNLTQTSIRSAIEQGNWIKGF